MRSKIKLSDYYLSYINGVKEDYFHCRKKLKDISKEKQALIDYIEINKEDLFKYYKIDVLRYTIEWGQRKYNPSKALYQQVLKHIKHDTEEDNRECLIQCLKYCQCLEREYTSINNYNLILRKLKLKQADYIKIINKVYDKIQEYALKGYGYKFNYGIGTFCINYWKHYTNFNFKNYINFNESRKLKQKLLEQGYTPYNKEDAKKAQEAGVPYDGKQYLVYTTDAFWYEITFIKSKLFRKKELEYQRSEYIPIKFKGYTHAQLADNFINNEKDIYEFPVDIRVKLNMLLYKYPNKYLNFIRNADNLKYKY